MSDICGFRKHALAYGEIKNSVRFVLFQHVTIKRELAKRLFQIIEAGFADETFYFNGDLLRALFSG